MRLKRNKLGRDFIIGDLHGCYNLLQDRLWRVEFDTSTDRLFSVGDLIDRGPSSLKCLQLIENDWFFPVIGNHEQMMLDVILHQQMAHHWIQNGGHWHFECNAAMLKALCDKLVLEIPYYYTIDNKIGICHAQPPSMDWKDTGNLSALNIQHMLWGRNWIDEPNMLPVKNIDLTYHGHTITKESKQIGNCRFIDTGAFHTGNLYIEEINYAN